MTKAKMLINLNAKTAVGGTGRQQKIMEGTSSLFYQQTFYAIGQCKTIELFTYFHNV